MKATATRRSPNCSAIRAARRDAAPLYPSARCGVDCRGRSRLAPHHHCNGRGARRHGGSSTSAGCKLTERRGQAGQPKKRGHRAALPRRPLRAPTGASLSELSSADSEPANWKRWGQRLSAQWWEAVALSIDIEPESLPIDWRPADYSDPLEECPCEFKCRIDIALNHTANGTLRLASLALGNSLCSTVNLSDFACWAASLGWKLPDRFPRASNPNSGSALKGTVSAGVGGNIEQERPKQERRRGPSPTKPKIEHAAKLLIKAGKIPARLG